MYYVMAICCHKESGPLSSDSDSDGDGTNLQIPKPSKVLSAINVCRRYISANSCGE